MGDSIMISNNSVLTSECNSYEITQFYYAPQVILPPDNKTLQSLYGFFSYTGEWDEITYQSNVAQTVIVRDCAIMQGSNTLIVVNEPTLNDFFVGQKVEHEYLPSNTVVERLDLDNFSLILNTNSLKTSFGKFTFTGFIPNGDKITLANTENLSSIDNFYTDCAAVIDVLNVPGELVYYRNIIGYDAATKTILLDEPLTDYPPVNTSSTVKMVYDNEHPPKPKDTVKYKKEIFNNMFYLKKITSKNISPVVKRIDWSEGSVYDYYRDDAEIMRKSEDGTPIYKFYVMNQFYQVFKCLWNNNGGPSTVEPYFVAGNFDDTTNIFYDPDDGYKWKYMFTEPYSKLQQFMDENWIPIPVSSPPEVLYSTEKAGGIEVINVIDGGSGYDIANTVVDVNIVGDGVGATAYAEVDKTTQTIQNIVVKTTGYNYTSANVVISSTVGGGASAIASISPIGGNASDIMSELGCDRVMVTFLFQSSENNKLPINLKMRQLGLLSSPTANSTYPQVANAESYSTSTDIIVSNGFGLFQDGEIIYQTPNNANFANATFFATCVNFEEYSNKIRAINVNGTYTNGYSLYGLSSGTARTLLQVFDPDLIKYTGHIIHVENRQEIQRSSDGLELFRLVLKM